MPRASSSGVRPVLVLVGSLFQTLHASFNAESSVQTPRTFTLWTFFT